MPVTAGWHLNDFRAAIGFERHTRMEDFSNEPDGGDSAGALPEPTRSGGADAWNACGVVQEDGMGCTRYMGFAIVSDALSSIRHDRLYTTDYTPTMYQLSIMAASAELWVGNSLSN